MDAENRQPEQQTPFEISWSEAGLRFMATISRGALDEIKTECQRALKVIPRRGAEAGGLLFGTVETRDGECAITIDGSSVFPIEHRFGPAYRMSEADEARFAEVVRSFGGGALIGAYHSTLERSSRFIEQDQRIATAFFAGKTSVTLVCFPDTRGSIAGSLFVWDENGQQHHFDFEMGRAFASRPIPITPTPVTATPVTAGPISPGPISPGRVRQAPGSESREEPPRPQRLQRETVSDPAPIEEDSEAEAPYAVAGPTKLPRGWRPRIPAGNTLMLAVIGVAGIIAAAGLLRSGFSGKTAPRSRAAATPQTAVVDANGHLDLKVARQGTALQVTWNSSAPESAQAQSGTFTVMDGGINRVMNLTSQDVRTGSLVYLPSSDDLRVELRLDGPTGGYSQSLRVMGSQETVPPPLFPPALPLPSLPVRGAEQSRGASIPRARPEVFDVFKEKPRPAISNRQASQPPGAVPSAAQGTPQAAPASSLPQASAPASGRGAQVVPGTNAAGPAPAVAEVSPAPGRAVEAGTVPGAIVPGGTVPGATARPAPAESAAPAPRVDAPAERVVTAQSVSPPSPVPALPAGPAANPPGGVVAGPPAANSTPARAIQRVNPVLPAAFSPRRVDPGSEVQIQVQIDPKGRVSGQRVLNANKVFNQALINSAMDAARKWQFEPARQNGVPVYSQMILNFQFGTGKP